jgi:GNAT superfamily N-acetyltransferase
VAFRFQVEKWADTLGELRDLFPLLWEEVALHKDQMKFDVDEEQYATLEQLGWTHLVTAREPSGRIAGYMLLLLVPAAHYRGAGLFALCDMYFVRPECRVGGLGAKLISFATETVRGKTAQTKNGIQKVVRLLASHKVAHDHSGIFLALGFTPCDVMYSKYFGDK